MSQLEEAQLPPVVADLCAEGEDGRHELIGGACAACGKSHYPRQEICRGCLAPTRRSLIGGTGRIYSFTRVRSRAPYGLPEPYAVGYVDLDRSGLRVFGLFAPQATEQLRIGAEVELSVIPLGVNAEGRPCLRPAFQLTEDGHG